MRSPLPRCDHGHLRSERRYSTCPVPLTRRNALYTTLLASLAEQDALLVPLYAELLKLDKDSHAALQALSLGLDGEVEQAGKVGKGCWVTLRNEMLGESPQSATDSPMTRYMQLIGCSLCASRDGTDVCRGAESA